MQQSSLLKKTIFLLLILCAMNAGTRAQEYRIHSRGMLHETVFNTGDIGRPWVVGALGDNTNVPLLEWPSNSTTVTNGISYDGQHNIVGAGVYIGANPKGKSGKDKRVYSFCGGVGSNAGSEVSVNKWSFPISISRRENFPVSQDGSLNPAYNPDEAEEIITAKWATSLGVQVTRTSRSWSYPDYDDLIIYEYEFVYNGDADGNPVTIEKTDTLMDFMIGFNYGFGPSMYGYQRHYQTWKYTGGMYDGDQDAYWDSDYWLAYNLNDRTGTSPFLESKPEPVKALFLRYAKSGENGGGLCSPQAPGYAVLYYPTNHLAVLDPANSSRNESDYVSLLSYSGSKGYFELDSAGHVKQPFINKVTTGVTSSSKLISNFLNPYDGRWSGINGASTTTSQNPLFLPANWIGRARFNKGQVTQATSRLFVTGPYTIKIGDTLRYAIAEVCGYGAQAGKWIEGGQTSVQWAQNPSADKKVVIDGEVMTEHYLTDFGYPDYVNSKKVNGVPEVANVQQVANKAFTAYLGHSPVLPCWPESNPEKGSYKIPVPCPAPAIVLTNTDSATVEIRWNRNVESFTHPLLMGKLTKYKVCRSVSAMGPWTTMAVVDTGNVGLDGNYLFVDRTSDFKVSEFRYYAVVSVDDKGNESGKTNLVKWKKKIAAVPKMNKVYVSPNPFYAVSGYQGNGQDEKIGFYGLPAKCTIRIFTYAGELLETIEHNDKGDYSGEWFQISRNHQEIASGIYLYVVTASTGEVAKGKFVVIK